MELELRPRTEQEVRIYFARTRDPEIQARIPQRSQTVEQALEDYRRSLAPGADSYGRTVWADGLGRRCLCGGRLVLLHPRRARPRCHGQLLHL